MNEKAIESIANAVLYEGYMLYPYRSSAIKNRQRWNFGVVYPKEYSAVNGGGEPWFIQTECLVRGPGASEVRATVRFLQSEVPEERADVVERRVDIPPTCLADFAAQPLTSDSSFPGELRARIETAARELRPEVWRLRVQISNLTPYDVASGSVLDKRFLSTHTILAVSGGEFMSLMDPPANVQAEAAACQNIGMWPVLAGDKNSRDAMLSSPIILYDYPQIAPESPGDLFDGTEIDEILALRILTLSDEEKREIREGDERARAVLERIESLPAEHFMKLHGVLRNI